ncbi:hypothetical protein GGX14DRAFT_389555 [Mycena pura]|uniref:Uncharacterized protein n=1 Tax=Mycena pura TaxID=153505 RepID=A0AAD6VTU0_9AGAR|nr:hypothetical protein GGX14DRAFT_389555 [Mycena pura]
MFAKILKASPKRTILSCAITLYGTTNQGRIPQGYARASGDRNSSEHREIYNICNDEDNPHLNKCRPVDKTQEKSPSHEIVVSFEPGHTTSQLEHAVKPNDAITAIPTILCTSTADALSTHRRQCSRCSNHASPTHRVLVVMRTWYRVNVTRTSSSRAARGKRENGIARLMCGATDHYIIFFETRPTHSVELHPDEGESWITTGAHQRAVIAGCVAYGTVETGTRIKYRHHINRSSHGEKRRWRQRIDSED